MKQPYYKIGVPREGYSGKDIPPKPDNFVQARIPNVYSRPKGSDVERLYVGVSGKHKSLILELAKSLSPPYFLLYVLHTSRGGNELARYQSPYESVAEFFTRFEDFLAHDGRHDLWLHSPGDNTTIVWDRHDVLFIYGSLDRTERFLDSRGFTEGEPTVASNAHAHHYHEEYDQAENEVVNYFPWIKSPLRPMDKQVPDKRD
jgi:hypothetical protein